MKLILPTIAAVLLAAPAMAANQTAEPPAAKAEPSAAKEADAPDPNAAVCKRQKSTGSRLGTKRVCMTQAQWAQLERDQREATENTQRARWKSE